LFKICLNNIVIRFQYYSRFSYHNIKDPLYHVIELLTCDCIGPYRCTTQTNWYTIYITPTRSPLWVGTTENRPTVSMHVVGGDWNSLSFRAFGISETSRAFLICLSVCRCLIAASYARPDIRATVHQKGHLAPWNK